MPQSLLLTYGAGIAPELRCRPNGPPRRCEACSPLSQVVQHLLLLRALACPADSTTSDRGSASSLSRQTRGAFETGWLRRQRVAEANPGPGFFHHWKLRLLDGSSPRRYDISMRCCATRCRTSPSHCHTPSTPSNDAPRTSLRYCSSTLGQMMTFTFPVSSSRVMKMTPFAVSGR